jgi:hypothetical protein
MLPLSPYRVECDYFSADLADSAAADRILSFWPRSLSEAAAADFHAERVAALAFHKRSADDPAGFLF